MKKQCAFDVWLNEVEVAVESNNPDGKQWLTASWIPYTLEVRQAVSLMEKTNKPSKD